jgi:protoporphyrinogen oxidase
VRHDGTRITEVDLSIDGDTRTVRPSTVVESIPITHFLRLLDPPPPAEVLRAVDGLRWRSQVYLFLLLDKPRVTEDNWIYFPNKDIPFGRVSEMKNFSADMAPPDKTSLFIEFFAFEDEPVWSLSTDELVEMVLPWFEREGFFRRDELIRAHSGKRRFVYPVYDMSYPSNLAVIKKHLDRLENLHYIGRPGRFKYTNQDHSLEMGIVTAHAITEGERHDLDAIGAEREYFEKGRIYEKRI